MATTLGQVKEFNPDTDSFAAYVERVNIFFTVNDIKAEKRAAVFLNFIGGRAYELLRSLLTPTLPQSLKYDELVGLLTEHYEPKPLVIAERFHFHRRNQRQSESIAEYMAELRRLSTHCEFKSYLNEALRDRLVCGLRSESMQRRLLASESGTSETTDHTFLIARLGEPPSHPFQTDMEVNGKQLSMEIDTGASVSIISANQQKRLFPKAAITKSQLKLQTYTGEQMAVAGQMETIVRYRGQEKSLVLYVVAGDGPTLMGRNWWEHIQLDWKTIGQVNAKQSTSGLEPLLAKHAEIFTDELGTIQPFTASLQVRSDITPKFCKARSVPFAIKDVIESELERLEALGILEKVDYSEWAAPIRRST